jgi:hypothetical protein
LFWDIEGTERKVRKSCINDYEVNAVCTILQRLLNDGIDPTRIGVISPYREQVCEIRAQTKSQFPLVKIASVDSFQGGEKDFIIISCVRSGRQTLGFLKNKRRLCVTLTRARFGMFIIGNAVTLSMNPVWRALVNHCSEKGVKTKELPQISIERWNELIQDSHKAPKYANNTVFNNEEKESGIPQNESSTSKEIEQEAVVTNDISCIDDQREHDLEFQMSRNPEIEESQGEVSRSDPADNAEVGFRAGKKSIGVIHSMVARNGEMVHCTSFVTVDTRRPPKLEVQRPPKHATNEMGVIHSGDKDGQPTARGHCFTGRPKPKRAPRERPEPKAQESRRGSPTARNQVSRSEQMEQSGLRTYFDLIFGSWKGQFE